MKRAPGLPQTRRSHLPPTREEVSKTVAGYLLVSVATGDLHRRHVLGRRRLFRWRLGLYGCIGRLSLRRGLWGFRWRFWGYFLGRHRNAHRSLWRGRGHWTTHHSWHRRSSDCRGCRGALRRCWRGCRDVLIADVGSYRPLAAIGQGFRQVGCPPDLPVTVRFEVAVLSHPALRGAGRRGC